MFSWLVELGRRTPLNRAAFCRLVVRLLRLRFLLLMVQVTVENGEADEEGDADQVLDPLDVLVEVDQREDLFDLSDLPQRLLDHGSGSFWEVVKASTASST